MESRNHAALMTQAFSCFEQGIARVALERPAMPQQRIVLNRLCVYMFKALDDVYNQHLASHGLTTGSLLALVMLLGSEDNRLNPCDLSSALVASRTNITRMSDELVAAGWVSRTPCQEDRRRILLSLTAEGRQRLLALLPEIWALVAAQWADFSADELQTLDGLLRKMDAGLARITQGAS